MTDVLLVVVTTALLVATFAVAPFSIACELLRPLSSALPPLFSGQPIARPAHAATLPGRAVVPRALRRPPRHRIRAEARA